ncbi:uncharacterized protein V1516DRAFT_674335 [Lipomyces oligophaga]|uniref:uncharacterized protein n=1 Tax=Lipomyces oligophaga TaxID=45792 RepID=UPI0034CD8AEE
MVYSRRPAISFLFLLVLALFVTSAAAAAQDQTEDIGLLSADSSTGSPLARSPVALDGGQSTGTEEDMERAIKSVSPAVASAFGTSAESVMALYKSFTMSFTMIIFSEIGDKTFLIAALMAMKHSRMTVFSAALAALVIMTILSAVLGHAVPQLIPKKYTSLLAAILFVIFGVKLLREGYSMDKQAGIEDEMHEVEEELEASDIEKTAAALEAGGDRLHSKKRFAGLFNLFSLFLSPVWIQTFVMTFLGEWGDRSQIATIAMAAGQDYWFVIIGAIVGHGLCTLAAVVGGKLLAAKISMRTITFAGGAAFLVFAVIYFNESMSL